MKKMLVLILGTFLLFGLRNVNAQNVVNIKPFKPSKEDAAEIDRILKSLNSEAYEIKVIQQDGKVETYGALKSGDVKKVGKAKSISSANNFATSELIAEKMWIVGSKMGENAAKRLKAIAEKYQ